MGNMFLRTGDKEVLELYKHLRIGEITKVDRNTATVTISWLDKKGKRTVIPLSMPFAEQGWGIYAMPRMHAIVACLSRPYEFPVIIGYLPPNFMGDPNAWLNFTKASSFPQTFDSGELILRNMINKAKCDTCGKVSTLDAWAGTAGYNDSSQKVIMEKCPICGTVSYTVDNEGNIVDVHKIQLGTLIYFQKDGKLSIKITDGLSENKGDTFASGSLIDIEFDDKSNLVMTGIQNFTESYISKLEIAKQNNTVSAGGIVTFIGNVNLPTEQQITIANDIKLGKDASKLVARKTDAIKSTDSEDSTYWDWFSDFATKVTDWINRANSGATPDPTLLVDIQAWQALNPTPDSLTGQITEGSSKVKAED